MKSAIERVKEEVEKLTGCDMDTVEYGDEASMLYAFELKLILNKIQEEEKNKK